MIKKEEVDVKSSCWNKAKPEEMLFVLLARDESAPVAIRAWIEDRIKTGKNKADDPQIVEAQKCILGMMRRYACTGCGWIGPYAKAMSYESECEPPICPVCG